MTAINSDHPNHGSPYPSITWLTEVTEQRFMALTKTILLHCSGSKQTTEIQQDIIVISRVWGRGPNKPKPRVAVRLPRPEVQGSGNRDEDTGHRLVSMCQTLIFIHIGCETTYSVTHCLASITAKREYPCGPSGVN